MVQFDQPIISNDQSLVRVLQAGLPLALIFHDGALPSDLRQALDQAAQKYAGDVLVVLILAGENPESTRRFGIQRFPGLVMVRDGQPVSQAGGVDAGQFQAHLDYLLRRGPKPSESDRPVEENRPGTGMGIVKVNDQNFERDVLQASGTVLVDFWAPWCGPCRLVNPVLEKMSRELAGRLRIAKVNVDENPQTAGRYGVQSIPTMMIFKDGRMVDRWTGALPEPAIRSRVSHQIS